MFTLLFTFVFGGALAGSPREYLQFFLPGILVQTVVLQRGLFRDGAVDGPRQGAVRPVPDAADLAAGALRRADGGGRAQAPDRGADHPRRSGWCSATGRRRGWRAWRRGSCCCFAVGFGMGWIFIVLGLLIRTPTTVMTLGFTLLFPLVFASNIMVDPATMPGWLRAVVEANPITWMTTAIRGLMGGGATVGAGGAGAGLSGGADGGAGAGDALALRAEVRGISEVNGETLDARIMHGTCTTHAAAACAGSGG